MMMQCIDLSCAFQQLQGFATDSEIAIVVGSPGSACFRPVTQIEGNETLDIGGVDEWPGQVWMIGKVLRSSRYIACIHA